MKDKMRRLRARFLNARKLRKNEQKLGIEPLENRSLMATGGSALLFDFGTATSPVANYAIGEPFSQYTPVQHFGWTSNIGGAIDRGSTGPLTRDFNYGVDNTFEVDLPNGPYTITPTLGDASGTTQVSIWAQGVPLASNLATKKAGQFLTPNYQVTVTNGQL